MVVAVPIMNKDKGIVPQTADLHYYVSCRVFQRIATLGLYLFNDALVITKRTSKHFPFSRAIEYTYKFETSLALTSMQVVDMPDSKCECFLFVCRCGQCLSSHLYFHMIVKGQGEGWVSRQFGLFLFLCFFLFLITGVPINLCLCR